MAKNSIVPLTELIAQFERLPGIGRKTAQRQEFWENSQMQGAGPQAALVAGKGRQRRRWLVLPEIPGKAFLWAHR